MIIDGDAVASAMSGFAQYVVLPVLCLMLFKFLNKRSGSDFYHSVPHKRSTLYISFSASIMTWVVGAILISYIIPLFATMLNKHYYVEWGDYLTQVLGSIIPLVETLGVFMLAISLSSTLLNQVCAAMLIQYLPAILYQVMKAIILDNARIFTQSTTWLDILLDGNIPMSIFGVSTNTSGYYWLNIISTLLVGIALYLIGMWCFVRRRSEAATASAANRGVQCAIRTLAAFVPCLACCVDICFCYFNNRIPDFSLLIILYFISLVAYFLYEVLSTRSFRGIKNSWKDMLTGLAILVALNIAFTVLPIAVTNNALRFTPSADEVSSVCFSRADYYDSSYEMLTLSDTQVNDPKIIKVVTDALGRNVCSIKNGEDLDYFELTVTLNMKNGGSKERNIFLGREDYKELYRLMAKDESCIYSLLSMPDVDKIADITIGSPDGDYYSYYEDYNLKLSDEQRLSLYKSLRKEAATLPKGQQLYLHSDDSDLFEYAREGYKYDQIGTICTIQIGGYYEGEYFSSEYRVTTLTPITMALYSQYTDKRIAG